MAKRNVKVEEQGAPTLAQASAQRKDQTLHFAEMRPATLAAPREIGENAALHEDEEKIGLRYKLDGPSLGHA
jgi:hypothetical protein